MDTARDKEITKILHEWNERGPEGEALLLSRVYDELKRQARYLMARERSCYPISYARTIVGAEPTELFGWQVSGPDGSDESFYGQMRFENGIHMQFDSGFKSPSRSYIEIVGTDGVLQIPNPFKPGLKSEIYLTKDDVRETIKIKAQELYLGEVEDMCNAISAGQPTRISLADSRANVAVILALLASAETGKSTHLGDFV